MKQLLVLVLVVLAVAAYAETVEAMEIVETDPLLGLPLEGCTEEQILTVFEEKELTLTVIDWGGEYRGEFREENETYEVTVDVYDGKLTRIESFWGFDSPTVEQREEIEYSIHAHHHFFSDVAQSRPELLETEGTDWTSIRLWEFGDYNSITLSIDDNEDYIAFLVGINLL
ncbi:hypothetical protein K8R78_00085 [bacterium]|nr:hypothetical protein [bacterium]